MAIWQFTSRLGLLLLGVAVAALGCWGGLAIVLTDASPSGWRWALAGSFVVLCLACLVALCMARWRWRVLPVYLLALAALFYWWQSLEPSNTRNWQTDVAVLPYATIAGDQVTVHNIRNFHYRSETDYSPAYYDKQFDLNQLQGVDLVSVYWMGPAVAHVFLSFAFADGQHLAVSIETRKEQGEGYSTLRGFFRQYELYYVVADERDVIGLRTNYRHNPPEEVYLYRLHGSLENARKLFLEYLNNINALQQQPQFYNTLTTNCTTQIWMSARVNPQHVPLSWKILASGYVPEYLYEQGLLGTAELPFAELQRRALVNGRAQAAGDSADFSRLIRATPGSH